VTVRAIEPKAAVIWLMLQKLEHREQRIALEELLGAVRQERERVERLEQAIRDAVRDCSGVTSIEYAMIASMIAVAILAGGALALAPFDSRRVHGCQFSRVK